MPDFPDYYAVLGVTPDAPPEQIEAAYLDLQDVGATPAGLKRIQEAYDLLRHPGKRRDYDAWYASWRTQARTESPLTASIERTAARHACLRCAGTGRTNCLVCEGRGGPNCMGCGGKRTHTCVLCLGLGTLSDAFHREVQAEFARAARRPNENDSLGLQKVTLAHHAAPDGGTRVLRAGALVVLAVLVLLALHAARNIYRQAAPQVETSREPTAAAPAPPSSEPPPPMAALAPKVLSAPPARASGGDRYASKASQKPRTVSRQLRATPTRKASAPPRTPSRAQTPAVVAAPVAPAPTASPPALPEAIDRHAIAGSILEMIADWADALADGHIDSHVLHYADVLERYFTRRNVTRQVVHQDKERLLSTYPTVVRYRIRNLEVVPVSADVAIAVFDKAWDFRTVDNRRFAGEEQQRLKLRLSDGRWKIVSEEELRVYWVVQPE